MAYFAVLEDSIVKKIHVVADDALLDSDGVIDEQLGKDLLSSLHRYDPANLIQCSYTGEFRGTQIGLGFSYDSARDAFIGPQPFASWSLSEETFVWEAPKPLPNTDDVFFWDEDAGNWVEVPGA